MIVHISGSEPYDPEPVEKPSPDEYAESARRTHTDTLPYSAEDFLNDGHGGPILPGTDYPF